jgi:hypothetical protein
MPMAFAQQTDHRYARRRRLNGPPLISHFLRRWPELDQAADGLGAGTIAGPHTRDDARTAWRG